MINRTQSNKQYKMRASTFKDLQVWQNAMTIAENVYQLVKHLPQEERYGLCDQLRRSAVSISSNIAEGQGRRTANDFINFLSIANGSAAEVETQLLLAVRIGYLREEDIKPTVTLLNVVHSQIRALQKTLAQKG